MTNTAAPPVSDRDLVAYARGRIEKGSKSFAAASKIFAPPMRASVHLLYAWCRHCDDEIDDQDLGFARGEASKDDNPNAAAETLARLRAETLSALDGTPGPNPVYQGLALVAERHALPREDPLDHLHGFAMDAAEKQYVGIEDTLTYCYHVAGVVGVMMARIMGVGAGSNTRTGVNPDTHRDTLDRASDLGIAFQLTNIARDVMDDAAIGRVYLPSDWLHEAGVDPSDISSPAHRPQLVAVSHRLLDLADAYYASASVGIARLAPRPAAAIAAARNIYADIGRVHRAQGEAAWETRARTSGAGKLTRVSQGLALGARMALLGAAPASVNAQAASREGLWTRPRREGEEGAAHEAGDRS
ncbi:MAG: phytoene/squalene synthase family protein [Pseudomonadota bacterium]